MSPTRKPKPPDKGAPPEHKPSQKVALAEVMRSLQDLVSNELAVETAPLPDEAAPLKKRRRSDQKTSSSGTDDAPAAVNAAEEIESITLEDLPEDAPVVPPASEPEPVAAPEPPVSAGGLQQELPYLENLTLSPIEGLPESPPEPVAPVALIPPVNIPEPVPETTLTLSEENWDDIPVLEETVDLTEDIENATTPPGAASALPTAGAGRRLAIQVAARLNVELRKSGQPGLNSAIITKLAKMLEEALAKGAANMENTTARDSGSAGNAGAVFRPPSDKH